MEKRKPGLGDWGVETGIASLCSQGESENLFQSCIAGVNKFSWFSVLQLTDND